MYQLFEKRINCLQGTPLSIFNENKIGLEKESLRVAENGNLVQTPHPKSLGSSLTHPHITTDYSEAMLEFVTPPFSNHQSLFSFLRDCQTYVYAKMESEILWATSMPCVLAGETSIPIAEYGRSNLGQMKNIYRRGLGVRYGRVMQVISGVHFNFSFSGEFWQTYQQFEKNNDDAETFRSTHYFRLIRNFQRLGWLIPYLFGASPAVCKSFLNGQDTDMQTFDETTYYYPYATSLRMGDIGYQNSKEDKSGIKVNYDNLQNYIESLHHAVTTSSTAYHSLGVKKAGEYQQLNANLLQIENEYYSSIRPKQPGKVFEMPVDALKSRGVEYIELRSLDVNAFDPMGISEDTLYFLEAFAIYCQLLESDSISSSEQKEIADNVQNVAHNGRKPGLKLHRKGESIELKLWANEIFDGMQGVCEILDRGNDGAPYSAALNRYRVRIQDPDSTPSARMLQEMSENKEGFYHFSLRKSQEYDQYFQSLTLSNQQQNYFENLARASLAQQQQIESQDVLSFDDFLKHYFDATLKNCKPYAV